MTLSDVNLSIPAGQILGILGTDQAGKRLLLQILSGETLPGSGQVTIDGSPLTKEDNRVCFISNKGSLPRPLSGIRLLLLDQPGEDLDWLSELARQNDLAVILSATQLHPALKVCGRIVLLYKGKIAGDYLVSKLNPAIDPFMCRIVVEGTLDPLRSTWFDGLMIETQGPLTILSGLLADQAALFGILNRVRDLGLSLKEVKTASLDAEISENPAHE